MTQTPWWHDEESAGDAAAEAARLFEAIRDRVLADPATLRAGMRIMEIATQFAPGAGAAAGAAPECAYCPVCQAIRQARAVSPETVERLTAAALEFAETVRQTLTESTAPEQSVRHVPLDDDFDVPPSSAADPDDGFAGWPGSTDPRS